MEIREVYKEWLQKAENDLRTAQILLDEGGPTDTLCFHCQQAVEKYLKAFLTFKKIEFKKIHDLTVLSKLAIKEIKNIGNYSDDLKLLNAYYIESRYPPDLAYYSEEEAKEALDKAISIINLIRTEIK